MIVLNLPSAPSRISYWKTTCPCGMLSTGPCEALDTIKDKNLIQDQTEIGITSQNFK